MKACGSANSSAVSIELCRATVYTVYCVCGVFLWLVCVFGECFTFWLCWYYSFHHTEPQRCCQDRFFLKMDVPKLLFPWSPAEQCFSELWGLDPLGGGAKRHCRVPHMTGVENEKQNSSWIDLFHFETINKQDFFLPQWYSYAVGGISA